MVSHDLLPLTYACPNTILEKIPLFKPLTTSPKGVDGVAPTKQGFVQVSKYIEVVAEQ